MFCGLVGFVVSCGVFVFVEGLLELGDELGDEVFVELVGGGLFWGFWGVEGVGDDVDCSEVSGCSDGVVVGGVDFCGVVEGADLGVVAGLVVC